MKKILIILILFLTSISAYALDSKKFSTNADNLFMVCISSITKLGYIIEEIQVKSGYILFNTNSKDAYLAMISENGETSSLKIIKLKKSSNVNNVREFIFKQVTEDLNAPLQRAE